MKIKRLLLKLSGEALTGSSGYSIDTGVVARLAGDIKTATQSGVEMALVVGGGNIVRGAEWASAMGMDRATADHMGMLGTVINALAFHSALERIGVPARVMSAIPMATVCEAYVRSKALNHLEQGRVTIFAAGTGNPYFTTDTTAALRAIETKCDAMAKATNVDGVYSADPKKDPNATRFERLTYGQVLAQDLKVMDGAAIALARDNQLPVIVFSIEEPGNLQKLLAGTARSTIVTG